MSPSKIVSSKIFEIGDFTLWLLKNQKKIILGEICYDWSEGENKYCADIVLIIKNIRI